MREPSPSRCGSRAGSREAVLRSASSEAGKDVANVSDQALHRGQYGHVIWRVNQRPLPVEPSVMIKRDVFGTVRLVCNWGRIGTNGQELVEVFASELEAGETLEAVARAKRRRGYLDL